MTVQTPKSKHLLTRFVPIVLYYVLTETYPETLEILSAPVKVCAAGTEQHCFACNLGKMKLVSIHWKGSTSSTAIIFPCSDWKKNLSFCQVIVEILMKSQQILQENRGDPRQHSNGKKTFFPCSPPSIHSLNHEISSLISSQSLFHDISI